MSKHAGVGAVAGDDWELRVTLLQADDSPFDLSGNPPILWTMVDNAGKRVIESDEVTVSITDALAGKCTVLVPGTVTTRLAGGSYTDALRLVMGGIATTLLTGSFNVMADPFGAQAAAQGKRPTVVKLRAA